MKIIVNNSELVFKNATGFVVSNTFINKSNGNAVEDPNSSSTLFIRVQGNYLVTNLLLKSQYPRGIVFYDANKEYISGVTTGDSIQQYTISVPANAKYVRLSQDTERQTVEAYYYFITV